MTSFPVPRDAGEARGSGQEEAEDEEPGGQGAGTFVLAAPWRARPTWTLGLQRSWASLQPPDGTLDVGGKTTSFYSESYPYRFCGFPRRQAHHETPPPQSCLD